MIATRTPEFPTLTPEALRQQIERGDISVVDVREDFELASEKLPGARHHPLSKFDAARLRGDLGDGTVCFVCRSGKRAAEAAGHFVGGDRSINGDVFLLDGGLEAWKQAGLPIERPAGAPSLDVMRQVQIAAGALILGGVILGVTVSPWFLGVSGFVGAGLMFAGITGWCGMAKLLATMPWNRVKSG